MLKKVMGMMIILASALGFSAENPIAPYHVEKDPQIIVEPDQTDIFAIPLDEDAQDQQQELYQLQHPEKKK